MKPTSLAAALVLAAAGAMAAPQTRPANAATTRPATQAGKAAKLDLDATVKLLTKRVGGKWEKDAHNAFLPTKRVVRGYVYLAADKVRVRYTVYPLELLHGRTPLLSTLRMCGNAEILGVSPACVVTVFSTAPADKAAPYSRAVTKALGLRPPKVTRRAMQAADVMKKNVDRFVLLLRYHGPQDKEKPYFTLTLSVPGLAGALKRAPWAPAVQISKAQAVKIIDDLAIEGFLAGAVDISNKKIAYPKGPAYTMKVTGHGVLYEDLGWGPKMLERLDALRKVLDGDAAKATDKVLKALEPQRKKWQKGALFVKRLKASKRWPSLILRYHPVNLRERNAYPSLRFGMVAALANPPPPIIRISRREAMAAIDALAKAGYFELAGDITWRRAARLHGRTSSPWPEHKGPCYSLTVSSDNLDCHANLGWDLKMLECLDALRKALDKGSGAAKEMDKLLKALEPQRKKWQKAATTQPASKASTRAAERAKALRPGQIFFPVTVTTQGGPRRGSRRGYVDIRGRMVVRPQFGQGWALSDGLACVMDLQGYYAYLDRNGKKVLQTKFYSFHYDAKFSEGLARFRRKRKWGFFNKKGEIAVEARFDEAMDFSDGRAAVRIGWPWGFIDSSGNLKIKPRFVRVCSFSQGLAQFWVYRNVDTTRNKPAPFTGYIDKRGRIAIPAIYERTKAFSDNLAAVMIPGQGKWGYIDKTGKSVIKAEFEDALPFSQGLAGVAKPAPGTAGGRWGFIDTRGKYAIASTYEKVHPFSEGLAGVKSKGKWGFIDKTGKMVVKAEFDDVGSHARGVALGWVKEGGRFAAIERNGGITWIWDQSRRVAGPGD